MYHINTVYIRYFLMYIYDISMVYIWYLYGIYLIYIYYYGINMVFLFVIVHLKIKSISYYLHLRVTN